MNYYLLDVWRKRVEFPELKQAIKDQYAKWYPEAAIVEEELPGPITHLYRIRHPALYGIRHTLAEVVRYDGCGVYLSVRCRFLYCRRPALFPLSPELLQCWQEAGLLFPPI